MSKPSILTQILSAVQEVNQKVDVLQNQFTDFNDVLQPLEGLPTQLTELDAKVTDIQSILSLDPEIPIPDPESPEVPDLPGNLETKRSRKTK